MGYREKKVFGAPPATHGYDFLPAGKTALTRRAKSLAKQREEEVFVVYQSWEGFDRLTGYSMPAATIADARAGKKPKRSAVDPETTAKRKEAARKAATTRKLKLAAAKDPYAVLLLAVRDASARSDRAKERPANRVRFSEYHAPRRSNQAWHEYNASRTARENDYAAKANSDGLPKTPRPQSNSAARPRPAAIGKKVFSAFLVFCCLISPF